jgi:hypothetical protein
MATSFSGENIGFQARISASAAGALRQNLWCDAQEVNFDCGVQPQTRRTPTQFT